LAEVDSYLPKGIRSQAMSHICHFCHKLRVGPLKGHRASIRAAVASALLIGLFAAGAQNAGAEGWLGPDQASGPTNCNFLSQSKTIVSTANGTAIAAWQRRDNGCVGATRIEAAVRPPGGTFSTPQVLSDPTLEATAPKLAIDASGSVIAAWTENGTIRYSLWSPGSAFSAAQTIAGSGPLASAPDVAIGGGAAVVAWVQAGITEVAVKPAGSTVFGAPQQFVNPTEPSADVDVAINEAGAALVTWQAIGPVLDTLHAAARPPGGAFAELATVFTTVNNLDNIEAPQVEIDPLGRATLLWTYFNSAGNIHIVKSAARGTSGNFGDIDDVSDPGIDSGPLGSIDLALDKDNNAIAVWYAISMRASVRPPGGTFGPVTPAMSQPNFVITTPSVDYDPNGRAIAVWLSPGGSGFAVQSAILPKGAAAFGTVHDAQSIGAGAGDLLDGATPVAIDDQGNAVTMWRRQFDFDPAAGIQPGYRIESAWLDAVAPVLVQVRIPATGTVGVPIKVAAAATDRLSAVAFSWNFGDGGTAAGALASHTYLRGGTFTVTVTATDGGGNTDTASGTVVVPALSSAGTTGTIGAPFGPGSAAGPQITGLRLSRSSFRPAKTGGPVRVASASKKAWTRVSYTLSAPGIVRFVFEKPRLGRRSGKKCVAPTKSNRGHKSCVRYVGVRGAFTRRRIAGPDRFTFTGRLLGHRLKAGRYRLVAQAAGAGGAGFPKHVNFLIR
jgi:hypothetical protein